MERNKSLIPKEKEYMNKIKKLRKELFLKEKELDEVVEEYVAMEFSISSFYKNYYLRKLGDYIVTLEYFKNRLLGIKESKRDLEDLKHHEKEDVDEKELKMIYRKLARIYHPDNLNDLNDEIEFYKFRMSEINDAFEKRDIKKLRRILKRAENEFCLNGESPLKYVRAMEDEIFIVDCMIRLYKEKKEALKNNEIFKLMSATPQERERVIEEIKNRFISDIERYQRLCEKLGF